MVTGKNVDVHETGYFTEATLTLLVPVFGSLNFCSLSE